MAVLKPRTALVLGTGQVGTFAARALAAAGVEITTADRDPAPALMTAYGPSRATRVTADLQNKAQVRSLLDGVRPDLVVIAIKDGSADAAPVATIARAASHTGICRLVLVSSLAVYSQSNADRIAESHPLRPVSEYGRSKAAAEDAVARHAGDIEVLVLRSSGVYGPFRPGSGSQSSRFIARLLAAARRGRHLEVRARAGSCDEYLYVKDLGAAIAFTAIDVPVDDVEIFNVGPGFTTTVPDVIAAIQSVVPGACLEYADSPGPAAVPRPPLDVTRIARAGFQPGYDLRSGIADYRDHQYGAAA